MEALLCKLKWVTTRKLKSLISTASISCRISKSKSNATAGRPDVIPIATQQCFPGSDLILMVTLLSNCSYYLYLETQLSGLKCIKLQIAITLNAEPVIENSSGILRQGGVNFDGCQEAKSYVTCKHVGLWLLMVLDNTATLTDVGNQSLCCPLLWRKKLTVMSYLL